MSQPKGMSDREYIVRLEEQGRADSEAMHKMSQEYEAALVVKDRARMEGCNTCGFRRRALA